MTSAGYEQICMELRKRVRYRLRANAVFRWESSEHHRLLGEGVTRDISLTGAFISTLACPPVGTPIQLDVILHIPFDGNERRVLMKAAAKVIRVEHAKEVEGFAVITDGITLVEDHKA